MAENIEKNSKNLADKNNNNGKQVRDGAKTTIKIVKTETTDADDDWHADDDDATGTTKTTTSTNILQPTVLVKSAKTFKSAREQPELLDDQIESSSVTSVEPLESSEREEELHRQRYKARHKDNPHPNPHHHHHHHHHHCHKQHQQKHYCQQNHHKGHIKELIKPDPTVRQQRARIIRMSHHSSPIRSPPLVAETSKVIRSLPNDDNDPNANNTISAAFRTPPSSRVAVVVDEQQLQERLRESISEKKNRLTTTADNDADGAGLERRRTSRKKKLHESNPQNKRSVSSSSSSASNGGGVGANSSSHSHSSSHGTNNDDDGIDGMRSPPPRAIIIPPNVAKSLSNRAMARRGELQPSTNSKAVNSPASASAANTTPASNPSPPSAAITREQLQYGPLLKPGEVQILYRSPESESTSLDRHLKEEQAKLVAPNMRQSPIAIMTMNPTYELQNRPLIIEYPARVENLKLKNTGFSWEVKIPYQISMTTSLYGGHLNQSHHFRLDQFHCHWGSDDKQGSEHTVDNKHYSAEMHFVHYNMEKYHTMSKAARHPDGLVVIAVFLEASDDHHNHAELEKIVSHLKHVPLKGEHSIIRQAVHIENLLPQNRSYWSYQGSLTTPPYFESVTWFIYKHPIRCNSSQIKRFRNLRSSLRADDEGQHRIDKNHRKTQPLNGRSIVNYDDTQHQTSSGNISNATNTNSSRGNSSQSH